ncbi:MAG TPA: thioredoxin family protein [Solirubrobacterales bacterium]|jgi:peroxiredoxin|nr:thioredoxin family protein [Solirubrobacterales bacterium]
MAIRLGDRAPGFELPGTDGVSHSLSDGDEAAATLVYWTCNHCPYALAWHERMLGVARDYADRGVRTLAINSNDASRYPADSYDAMVERVEAEGGWPHPYLHDESQEVARVWGAEKTPHLFVLDRDGVLRYRGAPDGDYDDASQAAAWVREALDAVLTGREPAMPETPAVGCGVKWKP